VSNNFLKSEWPDLHDDASKVESLADLMGTLVFLCSSDSDFMTGQAIVVDGGSVFHRGKFRERGIGMLT
jgi:NAD(P)-dependent dehydrogenase (short-subunit alcohol dehydrogenase family)